MRVIGGIYRGRRLRTTEGLSVRPTSDRLRETLFNILTPVTRDSNFLDLCAGSGAVGIEALSRSARFATFVEISRRACSVIEDNLGSLGITDEAAIINRDVVSALKRMETEERRFDVIFFDPPYASDLYEKVMKFIGLSKLLNESGILIVEHRAKTPPQSQYGKLQLYRQVKQGDSSLGFYSNSDQ
jgi:16S rRNA (guanine(966)-N(2))-methyltransferase RsmD